MSTSECHACCEDKPVRYAGFWLRFIAILIDGVILKLVMILIAMLFFQDLVFQQKLIISDPHVPLNAETLRFQALAAGPLFLISILLYWLYFTLLESSGWQATLGKKLLCLKVTTLNGERIGFGQANARYWSKIISAMIFMIGFMMAGWTKRKQALHDKLADTLVIRACKSKVC